MKKIKEIFNVLAVLLILTNLVSNSLQWKKIQTLNEIIYSMIVIDKMEYKIKNDSRYLVYKLNEKVNYNDSLMSDNLEQVMEMNRLLLSKITNPIPVYEYTNDTIIDETQLP